MTHAECQESILDLAYGELAPEAAADAESHVAGCAECRAERARLAALRAHLAPLREVQEPSPQFDARILAAARAEASLQSDGTPGPVIDMGRPTEVKPLGVQPVLVSPTARVPRPAAARPPIFRRRAFWGTSATAAVLAVLAVTTLRSREATRAPAPATESYRIDPDAVAREARRRAEEEAEAHARAAASPGPGPVPARETPPEPPRRVASKAARPHPAPEAPAAPARVETGSGGDLPAPSAQAAAPAARVPAEVAPPRAADALTAAQIEARAQDARHSGNYALAAALYREAAALHRESPKPDVPTAAWDLAHAVECLAAGGLFEEARSVQHDLLNLYPDQDSASGAAQRALRSAELPH